MAEYLSPGVYIEEFESQGQPIQGVSTSIAGFVGMAEKGPAEGVPVLLTNMSDFRRTFGCHLSESKYGKNRFLAYAVEQFFVNGGSRCYVMRVLPAGALPASISIPTGTPQATIKAASPGKWGEKLKVQVKPSSKAKTLVDGPAEGMGSGHIKVQSTNGFQVGDIVRFLQADGTAYQYATVESIADQVLELTADVPLSLPDGQKQRISTCEFDVLIENQADPPQTETFLNCNLRKESPNYVGNVLADSTFLSVEINLPPDQPTDISPFMQITGNDKEYDYDEHKKVFKELIHTWEGLQGASDGTDPRKMDPTVFIGDAGQPPGKRTGIAAFLDVNDVSILAVPGVTDSEVLRGLYDHCDKIKNRVAVLDAPEELTDPQEVRTWRENQFGSSSYVAIYHPWLLTPDPLTRTNTYIPPSGSVIGIYARTDNERGVLKAPANEELYNCNGLKVQYNEREQEVLNPVGVNLIRSFPGRGIRVWGARTLSDNLLWRYVSVRRLFIYLEESIQMSTNWIVFEPNTPQLWGRVERTLTTFLTEEWRRGSLMGNSPEQAFYVKIGPETMTQSDIDNGRLICEIGVAPVKPAEFVIFRISQTTAKLS